MREALQDSANCTHAPLWCPHADLLRGIAMVTRARRVAPLRPLRVLFLNDTARNGGPGRSLTTLLARLAKTNYLFRRLAGRYDEVNRAIFRIESGDEPTTDEVLERLKKQRLKIKDQIARMLTRFERRM